MKKALFVLILVFIFVDIKSQTNICFSGIEDYSYQCSGAPFFINVADINNDSHVDLIVSKYHSNMLSQGEIVIKLGNGDGTFQSDVTYTVGTAAGKSSISDFNNDGMADIALISGSNIFSLLINNGSGSFLSPVNYTIGSTPQGIISKDISGDGNSDLLICTSTNDLLFFNGNGFGNLIYSNSISVGSNPNDIVVCDFNTDGIKDIAVLNTNNSSVSSISILISTGSSNFLPSVNYFVGAESYSLKATDINNDSYIDLIVSNAATNNATILIGSGNGTFTISSNLIAGGGPVEVDISDFNSDGKTDLIFANATSNFASVLINNGAFNFQPDKRVNTKYINCQGMYSIKSADFNHDNKMDFAGVSMSGGIYVFIGNDDGSFQAQNHVTASNPTLINNAFPININNDGYGDIGLFNSSTGNITLVLGTISKTFNAVNTLSVGASITQVKSDDINNDQKNDLLILRNYGGSFTVTAFVGDGLGGFSIAGTATGLGEPRNLFIEDLNNDGAKDLLLSREYNNVWSSGYYTIQGTGTGQFNTPLYNSIPNENISIGDFNADGIKDLLISAGNFSIFNGNGSFGYTSVVTYTASVLNHKLADFNNDGLKDILFTNYNDVSIYLATGPSTFILDTAFSTPHTLRDFNLNDFNKDGLVDFVYTDWYNAYIYEGTNPMGFLSPQEFYMGKTPTNLTSMDFNNDGLLDLWAYNFDTYDASVMYNYSAVISPVSDTVLCAGESLVLNAVKGNYFYNWNPAGITDNITVNSSGTYSVTISNKSGSCISASKGVNVAFDICTNIYALSSDKNDISIFPNPNNGTCKLSIKSGNVYNVKIYNISGQLIQNYSGQNTVTDIDLTNQIPGMYLVKLFNDRQEVFQKKIIKE